MYSRDSKNRAILHRAGLTLSLITLSLPVNAEFYYRGDGMLYDSDKKVTWLIDASYSLLQDISSDGKVTWSQAVSFANNFTHAGYDDWRLPAVSITKPTFQYTGSDNGYGVITDNSELAYLYYKAFNNAGAYDAQGKPSTTGWGYEQPGPGGIFNNFKVADVITGLSMQFRLMGGADQAAYWVQGGESSTDAVFFDMYSGLQTRQPLTAKAGVWLVRDGDVKVQQGTKPQLSSSATSTVTSSMPLIAGTTSDLAGRFAVVEYQVNSGAWAVATGKSSWSFEPKLKIGANQIVVRAAGQSAEASSIVLQIRRDIPNPVAKKTGYTEYTSSFTDKRGRTVLYRYALKDGWDTTKPRGLLVYLHGNNTGTEEFVLDGFSSSNRLNAFERDLIPVNIASPYTRPASMIRQWMDGDKSMLHELLQSNLGGNIAIDFNVIVFEGASQGTCFLHEFLMDWAEYYGGGFLAACGCFNYPDPLLETSGALKSRFKVYVHNTTGDFLHETGQSGYGYYRYTLGLKTVGDFYIAGAHCTAVARVESTALDWILGRTELPVLDEYPRWERISLIKTKDLAADRYGVLWASQQTTATEITIFSSRNEGKDWQKFATLSGVAYDLEALGDYIFLGTKNGLFRSSLSAANFALVNASEAIVPNGMVSDGKTRLYNYYTMKVSNNFGDTWEAFGSTRIQNQISADISALSTLLSENEGFNFINRASAIPVTYEARIKNLPGRHIVASLADDGERWWVLGRAVTEPYTFYRLYVSSDLGLSWKEVPLPATLKPGESTVGQVLALTTGEMLLYGGLPYAANSWLSADKGASWKRVRGLETVSQYAEVVGTNDGKRVYLSSGDGVFALRRAAIEEPAVPQGPPSLPSLFNGTLMLPAVKVAGQYYQAELKLSNSQQLEFVVVAATPINAPSGSNIPEFANTLSIPVLQYGNRQFSVVLELISRNPLKFKVLSYTEIK